MIADGDGHGHLLHILIGTHVGEYPAFLPEAFYVSLDKFTVKLTGGILQAIRDDGHEHGFSLPHFRNQGADAETHRIIERCAAVRSVIFGGYVFGLADRRIIEDGSGLPGIERHEGDMLLQFRMILRRRADGLKRFIGTADGHVANAAHRAAFVEDDEVVDGLHGITVFVCFYNRGLNGPLSIK